MALTDSAGILFKIKADNSDAVKGLKETEAAVKGLGGPVGELTSGFAAMLNPVTLAVTAITAVATAAIVTTKALFDLAKSASDYGSTIFDASQQTGLGAETLSALKFAADQAGSSFEKVIPSISKFAVEVGKAAQGNEEAQKRMQSLGVTSTDLETALGQVFKTINEGRTATEKAALAQAAFGRSGREMIGIIKDANGNLDEMVDKAKELGVTITDDAMRAADEFGDQMGLLNTQLEHVAHTIGFAVMPVFNEMAGDFSDFLVKNKTEIKEWAETVAIGFRQAIKSVELFVKLINAATTGQYLDFITTAGRIIQGEIEQQSRITSSVGGRVAGGGAIDDQQREADAAAKERESIAKRNAAAQVAILKNQLQQAEEAFQKSFDALKKQFETDGDQGGFLAGYEKAIEIRNDAIINKILPALEAAELKVANQSKATTAELEVLAQEQIERQVKASDAALKAISERDKLITESAKKSNAESYQALKDRLDAEERLKENAHRTILARMEKDLALGVVTEQKVIQTRAELEAQYFNLRIANLQALKKAAKGNAEELARIEAELSAVREERDRAEIATEREKGELRIKNAKELLELTRKVAEEERRIRDFRREQERKVLVNTVESARRPDDRQKAVDELVGFDFETAIIRKAIRDKEIEEERAASLERIKGKENEEAQKLEIEQTANIQRQLNAEELAARLKEIEEEFRDEEEGGIFGAWAASWEKFFGLVTEQAPTLASVLGDTADILQNAFQGMANAIGNLIENWVLYGETGPAMMRKILASALASIAAEAAVRAIYELAAGFASLFFNPGEAAAHFTAAALFGSIAVGAALAGRAIAGDAFKKQTSSATGGASGQSASQDTSSQGQQFSGNNKEQIVDINANQPAKTVGVPVTVTLRIADDSTWLGKMLKADVETNGGARQQIKLIAQDA